MRPNLELLRDICNAMSSHQVDVDVPEVVISLMPECWAEDPDVRWVVISLMPECWAEDPHFR